MWKTRGCDENGWCQALRLEVNDANYNFNRGNALLVLKKLDAALVTSTLQSRPCLVPIENALGLKDRVRETLL